MTIERKTNHLVKEKSPYLLQHIYNPVEWYPWGEEAFNKAKEHEKPVFLSIGYSTCHWCHVMAHESFEDKEVADILNEDYICIKVDREERPDIDSIYMNFCQAFTGSGGWPLTIIMTPEGEPFFAGTYIPKNKKYGMEGLIDILNKTSWMWKEDKRKLIEYSKEVCAKLEKHMTIEANVEINNKIIDDTIKDFKRSYDKKYGGFRRAPKFPTPHNLLFLMRAYKVKEDKEILNIVTNTLDAMYKGGIFDHIGDGFSRYSVDEKWLVPHFEKMLYDNALLAFSYGEAYSITKDPIYKIVLERIFNYISRELTSEEGGFFCGEDADSEGVEGKYYLWNKEEVIDILGEEKGDLFCRLYDITTEGNFQGQNITNLINKDIREGEINQETINNLREKLFIYRNSRIHPHKDDKVLTSWNGLMIGAMAFGGKILNNSRYIELAERAVEFIVNNLIDEQGRLYSRYREGHVANKGFLEDYAFFVWGLIELYGATYKAEYLHKAIELNNDMIKYFWDKDKGGFYLYGNDGEELIMRPKEVYDGATPSGNSVAIYNILRISELTSNIDLIEYVEKSFKIFGEKITEMPSAHSMMVMNYLYHLTPKAEVVIRGDFNEAKDTLQWLSEDYNPFISVILNDKNGIEKLNPLLQEQEKIGDKPTIYICKNFSCLKPIENNISEIKKILFN